MQSAICRKKTPAGGKTRKLSPARCVSSVTKSVTPPSGGHKPRQRRSLRNCHSHVARQRNDMRKLPRLGFVGSTDPTGAMIV